MQIWAVGSHHAIKQLFLCISWPTMCLLGIINTTMVPYFIINYIDSNIDSNSYDVRINIGRMGKDSVA